MTDTKPLFRLMVQEAESEPSRDESQSNGSTRKELERSHAPERSTLSGRSKTPLGATRRPKCSSGNISGLRGIPGIKGFGPGSRRCEGSVSPLPTARVKPPSGCGAMGLGRSSSGRKGGAPQARSRRDRPPPWRPVVTAVIPRKGCDLGSKAIERVGGLRVSRPGDRSGPRRLASARHPVPLRVPDPGGNPKPLRCLDPHGNLLPLHRILGVGASPATFRTACAVLAPENQQQRSGSPLRRIVKVKAETLSRKQPRADQVDVPRATGTGNRASTNEGRWDLEREAREVWRGWRKRPKGRE
jgi:hypothetical protein